MDVADGVGGGMGGSRKWIWRAKKCEEIPGHDGTPAIRPEEWTSSAPAALQVVSGHAPAAKLEGPARAWRINGLASPRRTAT